MKSNDVWIETQVEDFHPIAIYHRFVETTEVGDKVIEEATYHPQTLEFEHLQELKRYISTGIWRNDGDPSPSDLWYLLVPKGDEQSDGWFPLPLLWEQDSDLTPNLAEVKYRLDTLMAEV